MGFHLIALQDQLMVMESYLPCPEQERPLRPIKISWYVKLDHSHANKAEFWSGTVEIREIFERKKRRLMIISSLSFIAEILLLHSQWNRHRTCCPHGGLLAGKCPWSCFRGAKGIYYLRTAWIFEKKHLTSTPSWQKDCFYLFICVY